MEKEARKRSNDPVQEKLRQDKDDWNKEVSEFIDGMKHLKKMVNGFPSKFHMEKSPIQEPLPPNTAEIIAGLAEAYRDIANKGSSIISEQLSYSKTRRKKQPKAPGSPPSNPTIQPTLKEQLAHAEYDLVAEGTTPLSRFRSKLKGPWFGKSPERRARRFRLSMLDLVVKISKKLELLEAEIMGKNPKSLFRSGQIFFALEDDIKKLESDFAIYKAGPRPEAILQQTLEDSINKPGEKETSPEEQAPNTQRQKTAPVENVTEAPKEIAPTPAPAPDATPTMDYVASLVRDFNKNRYNFREMDHTLFSKMKGLAIEFGVSEKLNRVNPVLFTNIISTYNMLLLDLKSKLGVEGNSFEEVKKNRKVEAASSTDKMNKYAQRTLKKWIGQLRHFLASDETTAKRHDILEIVERLKDRVEFMADSLEDEIKLAFLEKEISYLKSETESIKNIITPLLSTIKGLRFDKPFIDLLESKKVFDYDMDLPKDQKELLQKRLEQSRMRDLVEMHRRKK